MATEAGRRARVAVACDWFLKYSARQAIALADRGADVALLCRDHLYEFGGSAAELETTIEGVRAVGVEVFVRPGRVSDPRSFREQIRALRRLRRWQPRLVHFHEHHDPRLLALAFRVPSVLTLHDPEPHPGARPLARARTAILYEARRRARRLLVHDPALLEHLGRDRDRGAVVQHGVDAANAPLPRPATPTLTLFGRLEIYKGVGVALAALDLVREVRPDVRLIVAGSGPEESALTPRPGLDARPRYLPEAAIPDLLAETTLGLLPYTQASQSGVALTFGAVGVPCIVSDVGGLAATMPANELVVAPSDSRALADAVLAHLHHSEELRARVLDHVRARFSWEASADAHLAIYEEALSR